MRQGGGRGGAIQGSNFAIWQPWVQDTFRHFTRDELEKIEQRIFDKKLSEKKKKERKLKNIQVG